MTWSWKVPNNMSTGLGRADWHLVYGSTVMDHYGEFDIAPE